MKGKRVPRAAKENLKALSHLNLSRKARSFRYVVLDLETTGFDPRQDRVISVGALGVVDGKVLLSEIFSEFVNPGRDIPASSIKVHGIVPDMIADAPSAAEVLDRFMAFIGRDILVGHHFAFDLGFLNRAMYQKHGFPLQNLTLDTMLMCQEIVFPAIPYPFGFDLENTNISLEDLANHFGIQIHQRHTALGDALATAMIFQRVLSHLEKQGEGTLGDLIKASTFSPKFDIFSMKA